MMPSVDRRLSALFFVSGITGLIYEVVWAKHLTLLFGNTAHAHAVVLATFLGGLAIGNALLGPLADRAQSPLRLYGYLEAAVGVFGGLSPALLAFAAELYVAIASSGLQGTWGASVLRIALSSAVLMPPTILMGGTLPALSRYATRSLSSAESTVSWFYFLNAGGAVVGCLAAGFFLIPQFGLNAGVWLAAGLNVAIGVIAWQISRAGAAVAEPDPAATEPTPAVASADATVVYGTREVRTAYVVIFVSGIVSLAFQVAWIRLLSLILGSSTYSFSLMVAAFIGGIAVGGSMIAKRIYPQISTFVLLGLAEIGIAVSIVATMPLYERLPHDFAVARTILSSSAISYALYELMKLVVCLIVLLLPTTFIGMTLPLATRVAIDSVGNVGRKVGRVFSYNTVGNVIGAIAAGIFLLPVIGVHGLIWAGVAVNALAGGFILYTAKWPRLAKLAVGGAAASVLVISTVISVGGWEPGLLVSGSYRRRGAAKNFTAFEEGIHRSKLLFYRDDSDTTVSVQRSADDLTTLRVNGKADASTAPSDMRTQLLLAHIPLLLNPGAKSVLVVGLGSGTTAGTSLLYPIDRVDVVEISQGVVDATRFFERVNHKPLTDDRLTLHVEDAKGFLRLTDHAYDVIISEPSNPWVAGIGALFTREFYREAHRHLNATGVMAQWLHTYEIDSGSVALILRTFAATFPEVSVWDLGGGSDLLLLGSNAPIELDSATLLERFATPSIAESLASVDVDYPVTLLANQIGTTEVVRRLGGRGQLNEDMHLVLEYAAPKAFFTRERADLVIKADLRRRSPSEAHGLLVRQYLDARGVPLSAAELQNMAELFAWKNKRKLSAAIIAQWLRRFPQDEKARFAEAKRLVAESAFATAMPLLEALSVDHPDNVDYLEAAADCGHSLYLRHRSLFGSTDFGSVVARFMDWENAADEKASIARRIADILVEAGRPGDGVAHIDRAIALREARGEGKPTLDSLYERGIEITLAAGERDRAIALARRAVERLPDSPRARRRLSALEGPQHAAAAQQ